MPNFPIFSTHLKLKLNRLSKHIVMLRPARHEYKRIKKGYGELSNLIL